MTIRHTLTAFAALLLLSLGSAYAQDTDPDAALGVSRWDGERRFTVLFLGMDRRPDERETFNTRTDSIILASFDPANDAIGLLHLPRDLYMPAPEIEPLLRVNTLLLRGETIQDGYGPYFAMDTLQYNLGMYIDAYVTFDFQAFITLVDAIGGVEITLDYAINDRAYPDMSYGYAPFYLPAGTHLLDGETALALARTRHFDNDYQRGQRQLDVVRAIGLKAAQPEVLATLIPQAPALLDALSAHLYTDLSLADALTVAAFAGSVPEANVTMAVLNTAYTVSTVQDGSAVVIPDRSQLAELLSAVFGPDYGG